MPKFQSDDVLLDFDTSGYMGWNRERADRFLVEQPELYRNHLAIARWVEQWEERMRDAHDLGEEFLEGHTSALHDIAAHLRQGDFVPGRAMYEEGPLDPAHD